MSLLKLPFIDTFNYNRHLTPEQSQAMALPIEEKADFPIEGIYNPVCAHAPIDALRMTLLRNDAQGFRCP
ncbi:hypothetical protein D3C76_1662290 [compost metagenome]